MKVLFWFRKQQTQQSKDQGIIYVTITINKIRSQPFSSGIRISKENWNAGKQQFVGKGSAILNDELVSLTNMLLTIKQTIQATGKEVSADAIRSEFLRKIKPPTGLYELMQLHEKHRREYGRGRKGKPLTEGTFDFYKANQAYFLDYKKNGKNVSTNPEHINNKWFTDFDNYLATRAKKPLKHSSRNLAIGYIKHALGFALSEELIKSAPGLHYKPNPAPEPAPAPLRAREIEQLENYTEFPPHLQASVDCFLFLRYTGLHYIDGVNITESAVQVSDNGSPYLFVIRQKTEEPALVPYHPRAKAIVDKYGGFGKLPFTCYDNMRRNVKEAVKLVGIHRNVTPGTARDTFADDCANTMCVSDESLAGMLGHTTTNYVRKYRRININRIEKEWKV